MGQISKSKYSVASQRNHGKALSYMMPTDVLELTAAAALDADGLLAAVATQASTVTYSASDLIAGGLVILAATAGGRKLTITTAGSTPADAPATATITGLDSNGNVATEALAVAQTAAAATSVTCWTSITSIAFTAGDGTDATLAIGWNDVFGLPSQGVLRGGGIPILYELEDGVRVGTAGTITAPAASAPNGGYSPDSTPNGALDFAVGYEVDASALGL